MDTYIYIKNTLYASGRKGIKKNAGTYYWPKAVKDECWYNMDDVLAVISEPKLENRKFQVDENTWKTIRELL